MKKFALLCMLLVPMAVSAQTQYYLSTGDDSMNEKDKPLIEVYLPKKELSTGCAVVLCPGGAMRWLSWESDVVKMASFLNKHGIAAIGLRYHLNKDGGQMPQGMKMPQMVDVTHPEQFPQADANPMHNATGDSIIRLAAEDAKAAIRMVREHADEWNISNDKIGYLGFSAGGGVAIAATISASAIERPNFLCTNFGPSLMPVTVPTDAPPLLIMTRADHPNVAAGLVALFMEWKKAGANAELHIYGDGKGPYELMPETGETTTETWSHQMILWLKAKKFLTRHDNFEDTQTSKKVYNENINPIEQIDQSIVKAKAEGKFIVCQVGGNWCPWCLKFADFITNDSTISKVINDNFVYIHVNYNPRKSEGEAKVQQSTALMKRLNNAGRFGFPVLVVLDEEGNVIHIQDSSLLEEGQGYNKEKVLGFFKNWIPQAVNN